MLGLVFFFKQKTAYEMRISDWSSDVCSSDLARLIVGGKRGRAEHRDRRRDVLHPLLALLRGHDNFGGFRARDLGGESIGRRAGTLQRLRKSDRWTSRTDDLR